MYAVRYPSARAVSHNTGARWKVAKSASGDRPVHNIAHELKVPLDCSVTLPRVMRSAATASRKRALHPEDGAAQNTSARTLSVMTRTTFVRRAGGVSGGSGAGW